MTAKLSKQTSLKSLALQTLELNKKLNFTKLEEKTSQASLLKSLVEKSRNKKEDQKPKLWKLSYDDMLFNNYICLHCWHARNTGDSLTELLCTLDGKRRPVKTVCNNGQFSNPSAQVENGIYIKEY